MSPLIRTIPQTRHGGSRACVLLRKGVTGGMPSTYSRISSRLDGRRVQANINCDLRAQASGASSINGRRLFEATVRV